MKIALMTGLVGVALFTATPRKAPTVLYGNRTITVEQAIDDPTDLWVTAKDLKRINDFELKPEGACLGEICFPLKAGPSESLVVSREGRSWINLTGLARKLGQAFTVDRDAGVWSFSPIPLTRAPLLESAMAPDFSIPDRRGRPVRLSDFRGKKVMLLTWASW